ncbi:DUF2061 domain-containing protein [Rubritalea marina]|uniref:DUF2061 domain-containing protein n=1 Tax=Rubritalea marina TaxID=361055 RepID=UPI000A018B8D
MENQQPDSRWKSVAKGLTWRCLATLTTYLISWGLTGSLETASQIAGIEFVLKFGIYYMHERAWAWGPIQVSKVKSKLTKARA